MNQFLIKYHRYVLMFTPIFLVKFILFRHILKKEIMNLFVFSPQVRLHPHNLLLFLPDDGAQAGQQGSLVTPGVWRHAVI